MNLGEPGRVGSGWSRAATGGSGSEDLAAAMDALDARAGDQPRRVRLRLPQRPRRAGASSAGPRGVALFVDAIQGLGPLAIDVRRTPIDFLAADGHKWLLGPEGAGLLYVRRDWIDRLRPLGVGWHSVVGSYNSPEIEFRLKPNAQRWEGGSFNMPGLQALGASLGLLLEIGPDARLAADPRPRRWRSASWPPRPAGESPARAVRRTARGSWPSSTTASRPHEAAERSAGRGVAVCLPAGPAADQPACLQQRRRPRTAFAKACIACRQADLRPRPSAPSPTRRPRARHDSEISPTPSARPSSPARSTRSRSVIST